MGGWAMVDVGTTQPCLGNLEALARLVEEVVIGKDVMVGGEWRGGVAVGGPGGKWRKGVCLT